MSFQYNLVGDSRGQTLTLIFSDGSIQPVSSSHIEFTRILGYIVDTLPVEEIDEDHIRKMVDISGEVASRLTVLSERVSVQGSNVLFDGDKIESSIADHILRLLRSDDERGWRPLVNFLEKIATNPDRESRDSLYTWLSVNNFTLTQEGDFVAYKGVQIIDGVSHSISSGTAFVDGVEVTGFIPNPLGAVVTMPRATVETDRSVGCSTGLHAGVYEYAKNFSQGRVVTVHINPRDVVSVPSDCSSQKLRVSRYVVSEETEEVYTIPTIAYVQDDVPGDDEVECDFCGEYGCASGCCEYFDSNVDDEDEGYVCSSGCCDDYDDRYDYDEEEEDPTDRDGIDYVVINGDRYYRED